MEPAIIRSPIFSKESRKKRLGIEESLTLVKGIGENPDFAISKALTQRQLRIIASLPKVGADLDCGELRKSFLPGHWDDNSPVMLNFALDFEELKVATEICERLTKFYGYNFCPCSQEQWKRASQAGAIIKKFGFRVVCDFDDFPRNNSNCKNGRSQKQMQTAPLLGFSQVLTDWAHEN